MYKRQVVLSFTLLADGLTMNPLFNNLIFDSIIPSAMFSKDAVIKSFNSIILIKVKYKNILISFLVLDIRKILSLQHQRQQRLQNNEK